jgi:hypothetical protein
LSKIWTENRELSKEFDIYEQALDAGGVAGAAGPVSQDRPRALIVRLMLCALLGPALTGEL